MSHKKFEKVTPTKFSIEQFRYLLQHVRRQIGDTYALPFLLQLYNLLQLLEYWTIM